jgi:hypothetical protein
MLRLHQAMLREASKRPDAAGDGLAAVRASVIRLIRSGAVERYPRVQARRRLAESWRRRALRWSLAPAMAALAFAAGLFWNARSGDPAGVMLRQISAEARRNKNLSDVEESPFLYSNVSISRASGETVSLSFDVTTHVDVEAGRDDPLMKEVLIQSLINPSSVGTRLKAISYAEQIHNPELKQAVVLSMLSDSNVAVRLKAQSILRSLGPDAEIQAAFLKVLRNEESVQMRLQALDYLAETKVSPEKVRAIVPALRSEQDSAVLRKAVAYVRGEGSVQ